MQKLTEGTSTQPQMASSTVLMSSSTKLSEGWALRASKKSKHFNENQKNYLDEKFKLGQETGYKEDPSQVASDMRRAKNENGERRFAVGEFLSPQQIKSYFSRSAAKIKQAESVAEIDVPAIDEEMAYSSARDKIIQECQLSHSILYDTYNLCQLYATNKLTRFRFLSFKIYAHISQIDSLPAKRKAPYIGFINKLIKSCACFPARSDHILRIQKVRTPGIERHQYYSNCLERNKYNRCICVTRGYDMSLSLCIFIIKKLAVKTSRLHKHVLDRKDFIKTNLVL